MKKYYIFELRDSDGNDCTVYDAVVAGRNQQHAAARLHRDVMRNWGGEDDGMYGAYYQCDCIRPEDELCQCESNGGWLFNGDDNVPYVTVIDAAAEHCCYYHSTYTVDQ